MSRRTIIIVVAAAIGGALLLPQIAAGLLQPVFALAWIGGLLSEVVGQSLVWGVAAIVAGIALVRAIFPRDFRPVRGDPPPPERTREQAIARLVAQVGRDEYARWRLANRLAEQATQALALRDRISPEVARQQLLGTAAPQQLRSYLHAGLRPYSTDRSRERIPNDDRPQQTAAWVAALIDEKEQPGVTFDR